MLAVVESVIELSDLDKRALSDSLEPLLKVRVASVFATIALSDTFAVPTPVSEPNVLLTTAAIVSLEVLEDVRVFRLLLNVAFNETLEVEANVAAFKLTLAIPAIPLETTPVVVIASEDKDLDRADLTVNFETPDKARAPSVPASVALIDSFDVALAVSELRFLLRAELIFNCAVVVLTNTPRTLEKLP